MNTTSKIPLLNGKTPILGHTIDFFKKPYELLKRGYTTNGDIFKIRLLNKDIIVLLGPDNNKFFFNETDKTLSIREAYPFFAKMFNKDFYFMGDFESYKNQRDIILPCFHRNQMHAYIDTMHYETVAFIKKMGDKGTFDLTTEFGVLVMNIAAHSFLGNDFKEKLGDSIFDDFRNFSKGMTPLIPTWLPTPSNIQSNQAKKTLHKKLLKLINDRRTNPVTPPDFFQTLVEAKYKNGKPADNDTIINLILLLVWAGHETTAGHISWALINLLQNPEYLKQVTAQQSAILGTNLFFEMKEANQLKLIDYALKETERLHPVAYILTRVTKEDIHLNNYFIPKNTPLFAAPSISHIMPEVFKNPETYNPLRFKNSKDIPNHSLIGFGGGTHRCTGVNFAYLEMKVVLTILLQYYEFELINKNPKPIAGAKTKWPESPCRVSYKKRPNAIDINKIELSYLLNKDENIEKCPYHATLN